MIQWGMPVLALWKAQAISLKRTRLSLVESIIVKYMLIRNPNVTMVDMSGWTVTAECLRLMSEAFAANQAPLKEVRLSGLIHSDEASTSISLTKLLDALSNQRQLTRLDMSKQKETRLDMSKAGVAAYTGDVLNNNNTEATNCISDEVVSALIRLFSKEGNEIKVLRAGGNGPWPKGSGGDLAKAMGLSACVLEELDIGGSQLSMSEASSLTEGCSSLKTLTLGTTEIQLAELRTQTVSNRRQRTSCVPALRSLDLTVTDLYVGRQSPWK